MTDFDAAQFAAALKGPVESALETLSRMTESASRAGDHAMVAQLAVEMALLLVKVGDTEGADAQMTAALSAAEASGSEMIRLIVAWRYVAMLSMLDQTSVAIRYAHGLRASLEPPTPLPVRIVALSVAATVAASSGKWREVQRLSEELLSVALSASPDDNRSEQTSIQQSLVAQSHLGIAEASIRLDRIADAIEHATVAFELSERYNLSSIGSAALGVLLNAKALPQNVDIESWLRMTYESHRNKHDLLGEIGAGLMLAWLYRERGNRTAAVELFDRVVTVAEQAKQGFAWAKALIWRAHLRADTESALTELTQGWAVLREIAGAVAEPDARQALLIDWRTLAAETLAWLYEQCPKPLPEDAAELAVTVMTALTGDGVAAALRGLPGDQLSTTDNAPSIADMSGLLASRWTSESLAPKGALSSLAGCEVLVYRVLEARNDNVSGWRLHINAHGAAVVDQFAVDGPAAAELKRLAIGDEQAPTADPDLWRQMGAALLPVALGQSHADELIIVPHGPLWLVPFAALEIKGRMVVDHWTVSYLPSLAYPRSSTHRIPRSAVAAVDPELRGVDFELDALAGTVDGSLTVATSAQALDDQLRTLPDVLLIAAHGRGRGTDFHVDLPAGSVSLERFLSWRVPAWVVASSCLSGRHNAEVWPPSLVTVCRLQGASHVLGAVWEVPSRLTAKIVAECIRHVGAGDPPPLALRKAQRVARDKGWPVRGWAGLVSFG